MGMRYTICHWAINRSDPQNLLSVTLDVLLQNPIPYLVKKQDTVVAWTTFYRVAGLKNLANH